jgi:23S rRNA (cytosine1962-C5)-methyltransferase
MNHPIVRLKTGRERSLALRHPWLFSGAVATIDDNAVDGEAVEVVAADGRWLARGVLNRQSAIVVRVLTWDQAEAVDDSLWQRRMTTAIARRRHLLDSGITDACRLVYGEADGLPGLVIDRYGEILSVQALSLAADRRLPAVVATLQHELAPRAILHRHDPVMRPKDGLDERDPVLAGIPPEGPTRIHEHGLQFDVAVADGHKTGFYLDQRDNRHVVARHCAGADVLDAFCYTGGFSVAAAAAGARSLVQLDASPDALGHARHHLELNLLSATPCQQITGDAFAELRRLRDGAHSFDVVILDPPKFAPTRKRIDAGLRGYKDINLQGLKLVRPGGLLATFSCSGAVDRETFQTVVFQAAVDAGREVRVVADLGQPEDHPVLLSFPESRYLKGLLCRVE